MQQSDRKRFIALMVMVAEICEVEATDTKIDAYWEILRSYEIGDVENGIRRTIETYKYKTFPMPATFIENIVGDPVVVGLQGWNRLEAAIERFGVYQTPELKDSVLQHTINRFGGWIAVCMKNRELDDVGFQIFQRDFMRCYQVLTKDSQIGPPQQLIGLCDKQNSEIGFTKRINHTTAKQISDVTNKVIKAP